MLLRMFVILAVFVSTGDVAVKGRAFKEVSELKLPPCPTPRTGDEVTWYCRSDCCTGRLCGHTESGEPRVLTAQGVFAPLVSFDEIRLAEPLKANGPNWLRLPPESIIVEPTRREEGQLASILAKTTPPGIAYRELVEEIWSRGFEVFVVGGAVRDTIRGENCIDVDLVTTMPVTIASVFLERMYDTPPIVHNGGFTLGGAPDSGHPFVELRMFAQCSVGLDEPLFGTEFAPDVARRDFTVNAIYYDPKNNVFIDPTGRGIADAEATMLRPTMSTQHNGRKQLVLLSFRFLKLKIRGYQYHETTLKFLVEHCFPLLGGLGDQEGAMLIDRIVLAKYSREQRAQALDQLLDLKQANTPGATGG